jgi:hypothetical protein
VREDDNNRPSPARGIVPAIIALILTLLIARFLPSTSRSARDADDTSAPRRARVIIFLVDSSDFFDAHGDYVRSVIQQHCSRCDIRLVNLYGDLSLPNLLRALHQLHDDIQMHDVHTTTLVNLSLGTYDDDANLHAIIRKLDAAGVVLIASAGNDNKNQRFYPAAFDEVMGICSSTRYSKQKASYSNFGDWVSLCAPGLQYVTRPLQSGRLASGTSFASPMVTGILGDLLLKSPCASTRAGRRALLRTADPIEGGRYPLGAGLVNATAAEQYLHHLYACQPSGTFLQRQLARLQRLANGIGVSLAAILYFFASIFTLPLLLAFTIERVQRRAAKRLRQRLLHAYTGTAAYRHQRVLEFKHKALRRKNIPWRVQAELLALLHALYINGEPCWWCEKPASEQPLQYHGGSHLARPVCHRCGLEPGVSLSTGSDMS